MNYLKDLPYNLKFKILTHHSDNEYIKKNIKKLINIMQPTIMKIDNSYLSKNGIEINKLLLKNLENYNIFTFGEIPFKINFISLYPIILSNNSLILTNTQIQILNGFDNNTDIIKSILFRSKYYFGGIITDNIDYINKLNNNFNNFNLNKGIKDLLSGIERNYFINKVNKNLVYNYIPNKQGWISKDTNDNLKYMLNYTKPKNIVECGSWYGKSTKIILKNIEKNSNIYCFDKYQPVLKSSYDFKHKTPIDLFYFSYPRLETFMKNVSEYDSNIYAINYDALQAPEFLKKNNIEVDIFYLDFEKRSSNLLNFLKKINDFYPNSNIVGDDMVYSSVKSAISNYILSNNKYIGIIADSYIISNNKLKDYNKLIDKSYKYKTEIEYIIKDIQNNKINTKNIPIYIKLSLEYGLFKKILEIIKKLKLKLNEPILELDHNNTYYHFISNYLRIYEMKDLLKEFINYEEPKLIYNNYLLTYKDYFNYNNLLI